MFCNLKKDWSLVPGSISILQFCPLKEIRFKRKNKVTFLRLFDNPLSKYLTVKRISCLQWLFWVIFQNYKEVWDQLLVHIFCMIFPKKCYLFDTQSMNKVSVPQPFSYSRYQTKCITEFLFKQFMVSQTLIFIFDHPQNQWLTGRKRKKNGNTKI